MCVCVRTVPTQTHKSYPIPFLNTFQYSGFSRTVSIRNRNQGFGVNHARKSIRRLAARWKEFAASGLRGWEATWRKGVWIGCVTGALSAVVLKGEGVCVCVLLLLLQRSSSITRWVICFHFWQLALAAVHLSWAEDGLERWSNVRSEHVNTWSEWIKHDFALWWCKIRIRRIFINTLYSKIYCIYYFFTNYLTYHKQTLACSIFQQMSL